MSLGNAGLGNPFGSAARVCTPKAGWFFHGCMGYAGEACVLSDDSTGTSEIAAETIDNVSATPQLFLDCIANRLCQCLLWVDSSPYAA